MSDARKFRFVSPGIFLNEVDQSQIPAQAENVGPVIIGRSEKGPGMIPVKVNSFSEFVETFGAPIDGKGGVDDVWRETNRSSPTYGAYAAQAYLKAGVGPITFIRLMGTQHDSATDASGYAGWATSNTPNTSTASNGGAYGLFVWPSGAVATNTLTVDSAVLANDGHALTLTCPDGTTYSATASTSASSITGYQSGTSATTTTIATSIAASLELARLAGLGIQPAVSSANTVTVSFSFNTSSAGNGTSFAGALITDLSASDTNFAGGTVMSSNAKLAAVFYLDSGAIYLSGTAPDSTGRQDAACVVASDSDSNFKAIIHNSSDTQVENISFNMTEGSSNFIRNAFNTNPQMVNSTIETTAKTYWLGETFERDLIDDSITGSLHGAIFAIADSSDNGPAEQTMAYRDSHTGWFFAQNTSATTGSYAYGDMQKLFKFVGINGHGEWLQNNVKISLSNIKASSNDNNLYGTFDVIVRKASDSDLKPVILERFSNCTLDNKSMNYIGIQIGDMSQTWDDTENRYREDGDYPNRSRYIRVVVHDEVKNGGASPALLPFGVYGPVRLPAGTFSSSSFSATYLQQSGNIPTSLGSAGVYTGTSYGTITAAFPTVGIRSTATQDAADATTTAYFGLHTGKASGVTTPDPGYGDYLRPLGSDVISDSSWVDTYGASGYGSLSEQWIFTLDEIVLTTGTSTTSASPSAGISEATWTSGSLVAGTSWNASSSVGQGTARYQNILESKVNRFTSPMWGGFDGLDITERDPFRNGRIDDTETEVGNYTYYTIKRAIDTVADPEVLSCNIITMPGLTNEALTKYLIDTCEARADALGVIDVKGGYTPRADDESTNKTNSDRQGNLDSVLSNIKARNLNNSYGCAYYPWVTIRDDINGSFVKAPPSVVALGVLANTEKAADVWFAPAGFNRGGLSQGAGGIAVLNVETKLTSRNRDDLYAVNLNPIASFPSEGIVVFGQKTLQATQSALDRINVRRLLIYTKRGISQIASSTLFQPNVQDTWNSFKSRADSFLNDVKVRFGIDDFRVVLDETTTTPDLVDRNIMYAKIFIKPTRAIEFIAIDFIITRSGASFED